MQTDTLPPWATATITGADPGRGIRTDADVVVERTADGVLLSSLWDELADVTAAWNSERLALTNLLAYSHTVTGDAVPQSISSESFEVAGQFSIPSAIGQDDYLLMGYTLVDHDLRIASSFRFLRDSTAEQLRNQHGRALEADVKLQTGLILDRILNPAEGLNEQSHRVFGLWTGNDGTSPPNYMGKSWPTNTSHYWASGATQIDSLDIEDAFSAIQGKGYGRQVNSQTLIIANATDGRYIRSWRAGVESRTSGPKATYSFIPSVGAPARIEPGNVIGAVAPADFQGLPVAGSYGPAWLIETEFMPTGWVLVVATAGSNSPNNVVGVREHPNEQYRGLRTVPGNWNGYPMQDYFMTRQIGCGVRHRGAAVAIQVTTNPSYTAPVIPR